MHLIIDLIIRMQPYAKELKELCVLNADFAKALKSTHPKKFVSLGAIVTSYPPSPRGDEVIGFFVYDYGVEPGMFKQDFIVNIGKQYREFVIYTRYSGVPKSKMIKDINEFYKKYPTYDKASHRPKLEDLPDAIKPRALDAIALANRIKKYGLRQEISDEEYTRYDSELRKLGL